jgi:hypothetical protein
LYLSLVQHNKYFSVWNLFYKRDPLSQGLIDSDIFSTVGFRLLQVQLCVSYAYTGIEKLKGIQWWEGVAVWHVLGLQDLVSGDYTFLQNFPVVVGLLTMVTVIFEIYFPFAMMLERLKPWWLLLGVAFHAGTGIFMSIPFFCLVMISPYVLFVDPSSLRVFIERRLEFFRKLFRRSSQPA